MSGVCEATHQQVWEFFLKYQNANSAPDVVTIGDLYADLFMFGRPDGVQAVKKDDFLKVIPRRKTYFAALGVSGTDLTTLEVLALDSKYLLATVGWAIRIGNRGEGKQLHASATYVLMRAEEDALTIVFQIDHQDLARVVVAERGNEW